MNIQIFNGRSEPKLIHLLFPYKIKIYYDSKREVDKNISICYLDRLNMKNITLAEFMNMDAKITISVLDGKPEIQLCGKTLIYEFSIEDRDPIFRRQFSEYMLIEWK
jgi:hypothetical protein